MWQLFLYQSSQNPAPHKLIQQSNTYKPFKQSDVFHFKQFSIDDTDATMKVGTDALLLGALATPSYVPLRILDIGTGCGILALMMAQRFPNARIDAIDIDGKTVEVARRNFNNSPWSDRLNVFHSSLQQFSLNNKGYDLVISNPPYFSNSLRNNDPRKRIARHDDTLPIEQLFKDSFSILSPYGCIAIIIPFSESSRVIFHASTNGLRCFSSIAIHNHATDIPKRIVLQFKTNKYSDDKTQTAENDIILRNNDNTYTDRYQNIISPFLLG